MKTNKVFFHSNNTIESINKRYILVFLPLILFGFYKNGYIVYSKGYTNIFGLFKPLLIPIIGFVIGYLVTFILNKIKFKKSENILNNYIVPIQTMIIGMLMPIRINIFIFIIVLLILTIIYLLIFQNKKYSINFIAFSTLIIILISMLVLNVKEINLLYLNAYESAVKLDHSIYRLFFGFNNSGISVTNVILVLIAYGCMNFCLSYKKEIPIYLLFGFLIVFGINLILGANFSEILRKIVNSSFIFIITFVATDQKSSPYNNLGMIFYSVLIIIFMTIVGQINFELSLLIAILLVSIITPLLVKIFKKTKFITK